MFIKNQTRGVVLAEKAEMADNIISRFFGLMGRATLPEGEGVVIAPCSGVHTMFMRFPIDVIYVNSEGKVVRIDEAMRPWRLGRIVRGSHYVVELPAGTAARLGTQVDDEIALESP